MLVSSFAHKNAFLLLYAVYLTLFPLPLPAYFC